jgi:hypothetical protein
VLSVQAPDDHFVALAAKKLLDYVDRADETFGLDVVVAHRGRGLSCATIGFNSLALETLIIQIMLYVTERSIELIKRIDGVVE